MAKKDVTIFKSATADRIIAKLGKGGNSGNSRGTQGRTGTTKGPVANSIKPGQQQMVQIVEEHGNKEGYYILEFVNRGMTEPEAKDHKWYATGQASDLLGLEVSGTTGLKADDKNKKAYMATPIISSDKSVVWVFSVGGSSSAIYDFVIKETFDGEPDRYLGDAYTNYEGREYRKAGESSAPDFSDVTMLINNAQGDSLRVLYNIKCVGNIEYHNPPIGKPPEPPDPLPEGYQDPTPPFATHVFRPVNLWRYY